MRTPSSALPSPPKGLVDGGGREEMPLCATSLFAAGFFATDFTAFFAAGLPAAGFLAAAFFTAFFAAGVDLVCTLACTLVLAFAFLRVAIAIPLSLFLAKHALRIEIADAAALAAGGRVAHRLGEGRLPAGGRVCRSRWQPRRQSPSRCP